MSFFAHAVHWRRQMYAAPLGLLLFLARSLLLKEKQWVESFTEREFFIFIQVKYIFDLDFYALL